MKRDDIKNWLNLDGKNRVWFRYRKGGIWYTTQHPSMAKEFIYTIDDKFSKFRKALLDGMEVRKEFDDGTISTINSLTHVFSGSIHTYSIIPYSIDFFKVGDLVIIESSSKPSKEIKKIGKYTLDLEDIGKIGIYSNTFPKLRLVDRKGTTCQ